jgi:hypothetical protein
MSVGHAADDDAAMLHGICWAPFRCLLSPLSPAVTSTHPLHSLHFKSQAQAMLHTMHGGFPQVGVR